VSDKPLLTLVTEALIRDFEGADCCTEQDIRDWLSQLDSSDLVNQNVSMMISHNPGWIPLLAARVQAFLDVEASPA
jgi:hypothetical protein